MHGRHCRLQSQGQSGWSVLSRQGSVPGLGRGEMTGLERRRTQDNVHVGGPCDGSGALRIRRDGTCRDFALTGGPRPGSVGDSCSKEHDSTDGNHGLSSKNKRKDAERYERKKRSARAAAYPSPHQIHAFRVPAKHRLPVSNILPANGTQCLIKAHHRKSFLSNILLDVRITIESDKTLFEHFLLFLTRYYSPWPFPISPQAYWNTAMRQSPALWLRALPPGPRQHGWKPGSATGRCSNAGHVT